MLTVTWTEAANASAYEVEAGEDGTTWDRLGRANSGSFARDYNDPDDEDQVLPARLHVRVATVLRNLQSSWVQAVTS